MSFVLHITIIIHIDNFSVFKNICGGFKLDLHSKLNDAFMQVFSTCQYNVDLHI